MTDKRKQALELNRRAWETLGVFGVGGLVAGLITQLSTGDGRHFETVKAWIIDGPGAAIGFSSVAIAMLSAIFASSARDEKSPLDRWSKLTAVVAAALAFWGVAINFWTQFSWWGYLLICGVILLLSLVPFYLAAQAHYDNKPKKGWLVGGIVLVLLAPTWPLIVQLFD